MSLDLARMWDEIGVPCHHRLMSENSFWEYAIGSFIIMGMMFSFFRPVDPSIIAPKRVTNLALGIRIKRVVIFYLYIFLGAVIFGLLRAILGL